VPGVVCYFNPNGEVLCNYARFREIWDACGEQKNIPLLLWSNIRFFSLSDGLGFMDTVGNLQLGIRDLEAIFPSTKYNPREIDYYLRNVSHYLLDQEQKIKNGDAIDGPGETNLSWIIELHDKGITAPPRSVMRLYPRANHKAVQAGLAAIGSSPT
jgi:hypothetical protein